MHFFAFFLVFVVVNNWAIGYYIPTFFFFLGIKLLYEFFILH